MDGLRGVWIFRVDAESMLLGLSLQLGLLAVPFENGCRTMYEGLENV
jgi:hypothetical protein